MFTKKIISSYRKMSSSRKLILGGTLIVSIIIFNSLSGGSTITIEGGNRRTYTFKKDNIVCSPTIFPNDYKCSVFGIEKDLVGNRYEFSDGNWCSPNMKPFPIDIVCSAALKNKSMRPLKQVKNYDLKKVTCNIDDFHSATGLLTLDKVMSYIDSDLTPDRVMSRLKRKLSISLSKNKRNTFSKKDYLKCLEKETYNYYIFNWKYLLNNWTSNP